MKTIYMKKVCTSLLSTTLLLGFVYPQRIQAIESGQALSNVQYNQESVVYETVSITRTITYNYYNAKGEWTGDSHDSTSVSWDIGFKVDAYGRRTPINPIEYTFPEEPVYVPSGFTADRNQIPSQTVVLGEDEDFEVVVNLYENPVETPGIAEGWYQIVCTGNPNFALDVNGNTKYDRENVQIYSKNNSAAQKFYIKDAGNGYYYILTGTTNGASAIDVTGSGRTNGTNIIQYHFVGSDNQQWEIKQNQDGSVCFISKHSGLALDFVGARYANFTNVASWTYHGGYAQKFNLIKIG